MKKVLTYWLFCLMCLPGVVSCGDSENVMTYDVSMAACIVSNVRLGNIPCVHKVKASDGSDSVIVVNVIGADYPMTIDHYAGRIFNADSLPYGTDVSKVAFTTLASSGTLAIRSLYQEGDTLFVATDSTDFRTPRLVTVYAYDGLASRKYNMEVRVHQEYGDSFVWEKACENVQAFQGASFTGVLSKGEDLFVYATKNEIPVLLRASLDNSADWTETALDKTITSPVVLGEKFFAVSQGELIVSNDGIVWTSVATAPTQVLSVSTVADFLVLLSKDGFYKSVDGTVWEKETVDEPQYLPSSNAAIVSMESRANASYWNVYAVGDAQGESVVWKHNVDLTGAETYDWNYYPDGYNNSNPCPTLTSRQLFCYDGALLQTGLLESGEMGFYCSHDEGRTWRQQHIPHLANVYGECVVAIDKQNWIWVISPEGALLRGRFKRLGWAKPQNIFKESSID